MPRKPRYDASGTAGRDRIKLKLRAMFQVADSFWLRCCHEKEYLHSDYLDASRFANSQRSIEALCIASLCKAVSFTASFTELFNVVSCCESHPHVAGSLILRLAQWCTTRNRSLSHPPSERKFQPPICYRSFSV